MRQRGVGMGAAVLLVLVAGAADARQEPRGATDQVDQLMTQYNLHPSFEKLGRGVSNALLGWAELPLGIHQRYSPEDAGTSFIAGAIIGAFKGAVRMGVGVYETVTFLLPYPEEFRPILPTLEYYRLLKGGHPREPLPLE